MNCAPCFEAGKCGEQSCPEFCLCCEGTCCVGPSISSTRMFIMDKYQLQSDEVILIFVPSDDSFKLSQPQCDNRLIRFNNCMQMLACICDILAIFIAELRDCAQCIDIIANIVFYCTVGW